jgi:hypothetical protein
MSYAEALPPITAESGLTRYLKEMRPFPMLEPQEEYMLAKSWREHGDQARRPGWRRAKRPTTATRRWARL